MQPLLDEAFRIANTTHELLLVSLDPETFHQIQQEDSEPVPEDLSRLLTPSICSTLHSLDLSRNGFKVFPPWICSHLATSLKVLNVSRNHLLGLPKEIKELTKLTHLIALSNSLRPRLLPVDELAVLPNLQLLDFQYNSKIKDATRKLLTSKLFDRVEVRVTNRPSTSNTTTTPPSSKVSAGERDATLLRSQLEPLSSPQLRKRLERTFNVHLDVTKEEGHDRDALMSRLLKCYAELGRPRTIRQEKGIPCPQEMLDRLLKELQSTEFPRDRERPKISAQHYMILQKPGTNSGVGPRAKKEAAKLKRYSKIWELATEAIQDVDPPFAERFTALAVTHNFAGSPHIDTLNVGPFYGISMGEFCNGGKICVECSATVVAEVDTKGRFGKVDGRFPHWVSPYEGTRFSLIYYVTNGAVEPQTTAVFRPRGKDGDHWVSPERFVL